MNYPAFQCLSQSRCFNGQQLRLKHASQTTQCDMTLSVYLPPQAQATPVPVVYWLSGLTCNDENFMQKAGAQRIAAELGLALVAPDTSPRGDLVPDAPDNAYDLGLGAGFYVDATQPPWRQHYCMDSYINLELPTLLKAALPLSEQWSICGHSMGGHGALTQALRNPAKYQSVSAFSPICNPMSCPWGKKAFTEYLGADQNRWKAYDASELLKTTQASLPILIDQGDADQFLKQQLLPDALRNAAPAGYSLTFRMQPEYDHSYFFIASFIAEHLQFHAQHLLA